MRLSGRALDDSVEGEGEIKMAKRLATSYQLEQLISERMRGARVFVQRDPIYGWSANLIASPSQIVSLNAELQQIVDGLREEFELVD